MMVTIRMVGMRMKIVKIPQGVPHLSLDHLDLGRASCPSSGAEWSGPVSLLIIMVMIDEKKIKSSQLQIILHLSQLTARRLSTTVRVSLLPSEWRVKFGPVGEHTYQGDPFQRRRG